MGNVAQLWSPSALGDMTVVDVSIILALLRKGPIALEGLAPILSDWFTTPIGRPEIARSIARMNDRGWIISNGEGQLVPAPATFAPVSAFYAGFFRMLARDVEPDARQPLLISEGERVAHGRS